MPTLRRLLVLYESEAACLARLAAAGLTGEPAREIACYLAQATDLPAFYERIRAGFAPSGVSVNFHELGEAAIYLPICPRLWPVPSNAPSSAGTKCKSERRASAEHSHAERWERANPCC